MAIVKIVTEKLAKYKNSLSKIGHGQLVRQ